MSPFAFKKSEVKTVDNREVVNKAIAGDIKAVGDLARACINSEQFQEYKRQFVASREKVVIEIINYHNDDIVKYGIQMMLFTERLRALGNLLKVVEVDARKGQTVQVQIKESKD